MQVFIEVSIVLLLEAFAAGDVLAGVQDLKALPAKPGPTGAGHHVTAVAAVDDFSAGFIGALLPVLRGHERLVLRREEVGAGLGVCVCGLQGLALGARLLAAFGTGQELIAAVAVVDAEEVAACGVEAPGWVGRRVFVFACRQTSLIVSIEVLL